MINDFDDRIFFYIIDFSGINIAEYVKWFRKKSEFSPFSTPPPEEGGEK